MDAWTLHQLADSALPTGGFAHSGGLEAALQLGLVRGGELDAFLREALWQSGSASLPWVAAVHASPARIAELDLACDASLPQHVANRASRVQGRSFLRAVAEARPVELRALADAAADGRWHCHLAPVFGAALARLGAEREDARRLFLFQAVRGIVQAAVRLGATGPFEAQRLLAGIGEEAERVLRATRDRGTEDVAATSPLVDLAQGHQDRLYSRLFQS